MPKGSWTEKKALPNACIDLMGLEKQAIYAFLQGHHTLSNTYDISNGISLLVYLLSYALMNL